MHITVTVGSRNRWEGTLDPLVPRSVILGSDRRCDVRLEGPGILGRHGEIAIDEVGVWVCAHAPLAIDGQEVVGWALVGDGARVRLQDHELVLGLKDVAPSPVAARPPANTEPPAPQPQRAQLGEIFALPPAEVAEAAATPAAPLLKRRFLAISVRTWLMATVSAVVGLYFLTTREVPRASADRIAARASARPVAAPKPRPSFTRLPSKAKPTSAEVRSAADRVFAGDIKAALTRYRDLAARDPRFAPYVTALEQKSKQSCTPDGPHGGGECL